MGEVAAVAHVGRPSRAIAATGRRPERRKAGPASASPTRRTASARRPARPRASLQPASQPRRSRRSGRRPPETGRIRRSRGGGSRGERRRAARSCVPPGDQASCWCRGRGGAGGFIGVRQTHDRSRMTRRRACGTIGGGGWAPVRREGRRNTMGVTAGRGGLGRRSRLRQRDHPIRLQRIDPRLPVTWAHGPRRTTGGRAPRSSSRPPTRAATRWPSPPASRATGRLRPTSRCRPSSRSTRPTPAGGSCVTDHRRGDRPEHRRDEVRRARDRGQGRLPCLPGPQGQRRAVGGCHAEGVTRGTDVAA